MKKWTSYALIFVTLMSLFGCSNNDNEETNGFQIDNWSRSLGSANENSLDESKYSYTLYITSGTIELGNVREIYPIIGENINDRLIHNERPKMTLKDNYIEVEGEVIFDTKNLTKEQILELEPYIVDVIIITEHMVDLNMRK